MSKQWQLPVQHSSPVLRHLLIAYRRAILRPPRRGDQAQSRKHNRSPNIEGHSFSSGSKRQPQPLDGSEELTATAIRITSDCALLPNGRPPASLLCLTAKTETS